MPGDTVGGFFGAGSPAAGGQGPAAAGRRLGSPWGSRRAGPFPVRDMRNGSPAALGAAGLDSEANLMALPGSRFVPFYGGVKQSLVLAQGVSPASQAPGDSISLAWM